MHEQVLRYATDFLGYGNPSGRLWFIGMEEAGSSGSGHLERRVRLWTERGAKAFEDSADFKRQLGDPGNYFGDDNRIQRTLSLLIRCEIAAFEGRQATIEDVRSYQRGMWGRPDGRSATLELSAFPQASLRTWEMSEHVQSGQFASRRSYQNFLSDERLPVLITELRKHRPAVVVCYGRKYASYWSRLQTSVPEVVFKEVVHPNARAPGKKQIYERLGSEIEKLLRQPQ